MSEVKKINEELLQEVKGTLSTMQYVSSKITDLSVEQSMAVDAYKQLNEKLDELKGKIREEHGEVEVDLTTGEIKEDKEKE